jgi:hypothetical protein
VTRAILVERAAFFRSCGRRDLVRKYLRRLRRARELERQTWALETHCIFAAWVRHTRAAEAWLTS